MSLAEHEGRTDTAANYQASQAFTEALLGNHSEARTRVADALRLSSARAVVLMAALAGDKARVRALTADLNRRYPDDTILQNTWLPLVKAQLALDRNDAQTAVTVLQPAASYEFALGDGLVSAFERGKAHLVANRGKEAVVEFQKIVDHRGVVTFADWKGPVVGTVLALAKVGLARAYALQGDSARARAAYQDFFALWQDADPDIPILNQAKAEYARLK